MGFANKQVRISAGGLIGKWGNPKKKVPRFGKMVLFKYKITKSGFATS